MPPSSDWSWGFHGLQGSIFFVSPGMLELESHLWNDESRFGIRLPRQTPYEYLRCHLRED